MTSPDRWRRIEAILDELLELPDDARAARLAALAGDDAALRDEVRALLEEGAKIGGPLDGSLETFSEGVIEASPPAPESRRHRIGPYRVLGQLGRGGMGEVLLAERADGEFEQRVALKVVRQGLGREEFAERFRRERQILARLRHPNIAALLDGGTDEDGVPYFAMELVEGERITDWADRERLDIGGRLRMFEAVCRAVSHAHRNLVIHRDLKPSNVLVTAEGTVKLLDFGIAKIVDPESDDATQTTRGFFTPAYASPEHVRGEAVTTATDVYSLGVLLFELLTGRHPHGDATRSTEIVQALLEEDPPEPSAVATRDARAGSAAEIAGRRGTDPGELRRRLRGDLDNIVAKALRRNPDERYGSVEELRRDIERFRSSEPVSARPATARYRFRKFVRRNRVAFGVGVTLLTALVVFAVSMSVLFSRSEANLRRALAAETEAAREAQTADRVSGFLTELFDAADPVKSSGREVSAREILDAGTARIAEELATEPEVRARLQAHMGDSYFRLGLYEEAERLHATALATRIELGGERSPEAWRLLLALSADDQRQAKYEEAEAAARRALAAMEGGVGPVHPDVAAAWGSVAVAQLFQGRPVEAESSAVRRLAILERLPAPDPYKRGLAENFLAGILLDQGRLDESATMFGRSVASLREAGLENDADMGEVLGGLASVYQKQGRLEEASELLDRALEVEVAIYGPDHPTVARARRDLGLLYRQLGRHAEAASEFEKTYVIFRATLPPEHPYLALTRANVARSRLDAGDLPAAVASIEEATEQAKTSIAPDHFFHTVVQGYLADVREGQGRWDEAGEIRVAVIGLLEKLYDEGYRGLASRLQELAGNREHLGRRDEAEALHRRAVAILEAADGADSPAAEDARDQLAALRQRTGGGDDGARP